ncbi:MAG: hypothetical protein AAF479_08295 [Pseudomonadota bacterium]
MTEKTFKFELDDDVVIDCSGETGTIIGRAEYAASDNDYLIRYAAGDGRAVQQWWTETSISKDAN